MMEMDKRGATGYETADSRGPGRPRDPATDRAILTAALESMARDGYAGMSVDAVAEAAGVTKPTIYRRWPSKEDLATAALAMMQTEDLPKPGRSPKAGVIAAVRHFQHCLLRPNGMTMIGTLLAEEHRTPALMKLFRERITLPRRQHIRATLERAREAGLIRGNCDLDVAVNLLVGSLYAKHLLGQGVPESWAEDVVELIWKGIERRS